MAGSLDNFFVAPAAPAAAPSASPASPVTTSGGFANFFGAPAPAPAAQPVAQPTAQPGIVPGASAQNPVATSGANENLSPQGLTPETQQAVQSVMANVPKTPSDGSNLLDFGDALQSTISHVNNIGRNVASGALNAFSSLFHPSIFNTPVTTKAQLDQSIQNGGKLPQGTVTDPNPVQKAAQDYAATTAQENANMKTPAFTADLSQQAGAILPQIPLFWAGGELAEGSSVPQLLSGMTKDIPVIGKFLAPFLENGVRTLAGFSLADQPGSSNHFKTFVSDLQKSALFSVPALLESKILSTGGVAALTYLAAKIGGADTKNAGAAALLMGLVHGANVFGTTDAQSFADKAKSDAFDAINKFSDTKIDEKSTPEDVRKAYREAIFKAHPDRGGNQEDASKVNAAYKLISSGLAESVKSESQTAEQGAQKSVAGAAMTPDDINDLASKYRESPVAPESDAGGVSTEKADGITSANENAPEKVFLTRHGMNANDETKIAGDNDQPDISEKGQQQMESAVPELKGKGITDVISSDAKRAVTSAKIVADGIGAKTTVDKGLRTQDIGNLAGKPSSDADAIMKYTNENHPDQKVGVDGESHNEFKARVEKAYTAQMARVKAEGGTPDIIAHGDVARLIQTDFGKKELSGPEMKHGSTVQVGGEEKNPTEKPNKDNSEKKPTEYNQNSEVLKAFGSSKPIKEIDGFVLGTFGERTGERKVGQADRFPESELPETISHITESYRASDNPKNYRYDNTANIAKMPDGETRVIYTRLNAEGKPEILNWHVITDPEYLETLKENGVSERNRTPNRLVRTEPLNPLSYGDKESVPQKSEESQKKDSLSRVVGGGETKKSGLATDIETRAIEDKIVKNGFENLTASERMVMADQEKMADDLYHNDPEQAIRIATGEEEPPEGVSASVVYAKVRDVSFKSGDSDTLSRLAGATEMNNAATAAGQFIKGLDAFRSEAAMAVTNGIKEINRALEESVQKSLPKGETVEKVRTRMVKRMKSDLASRIKEPTFGQVKDFIKSIEC